MRRKRDKKTLYFVGLAIIIVLVISTSLIILASKAQAKKPSLENQNITGKEEELVIEKIEDNKLDNSGYLSLEDDPNAEDGSVVAEITNDLVKGKRMYPVRNDGKKVVYLTFDDGPSQNVTPQILDVLDKYNIKGTFFILGSALDSNVELQKILKRIANDGHAIGNHTYSHNYKYLYPNKNINIENFINDIDKTNDVLRKVLGKDFKTNNIRFPGGYWSWGNRENLRPLLDEKGYHIIEWNGLTKDAEGKPKTANEMVHIVKERMNQLGPNVDQMVLLMHDTDSKIETLKALPEIIEYFKGLGFEFKTVK